MKKSLETYLMLNSHLTKPEREIILDEFKPLKLEKNKFWLKKGKTCEHLAFVVSGILRIINEKDKTVQIICQNSFTTSLTSFAYQVPSMWSIQALTNCDLLVIERETHFKLINEYKNWLELDNYMLLLAYTELEDRLYTKLHSTGEQRFKKLFNDKPGIFNQIPLKCIAESIGITPETLSRLRKKHL